MLGEFAEENPLAIVTVVVLTADTVIAPVLLKPLVYVPVPVAIHMGAVAYAVLKVNVPVPADAIEVPLNNSK